MTELLTQRSHAIVELSFAMPILISLLLGIWQFGYAFYNYAKVEQAKSYVEHLLPHVVFLGQFWLVDSSRTVRRQTAMLREPYIAELALYELTRLSNGSR